MNTMENCNPLVLTPINGELRIRDIDLAKRLGFANPIDIRKIVRRYEGKLKEFSVLAVVAKTSGEQGGRPSVEYYLDRQQSLFICMKSETDTAFEVQVDVIRVYDDHLSGKSQPASAIPPISDPTLAVLMRTIVELDTIKQHTAAIDRKIEVLEVRTENVELQHRNGVPHGYLSKAQAHHLHGSGLSEDIFHRAMEKLAVPIEKYVATTEDGYQSMTHGYLATEIASAVRMFIGNAVQVTRCMCESPLLDGKRFRYVKSSTARMSLDLYRTLQSPVL